MSTIKRFNIILKYCTFLLLTFKGVLHFTSPQDYNVLFSNSTSLSYGIGAFLILSGFLALFKNHVLRMGSISSVFVISSLILLFQTYCGYLKVGLLPEHILEHSLQIGLPIVYMIQLQNSRVVHTQILNTLKLLVAFTFIGHGVYAIGYHILPSHFVSMTTGILSIGKTPAVDFLWVVGTVDIFVAVLLFVPAFQTTALIYCTVWGLLTSFARLYFDPTASQQFNYFAVNIPSVLYRLPHGIIPLLVFMLSTVKKKVVSLE
jgi:hypothetical protein